MTDGIDNEFAARLEKAQRIAADFSVRWRAFAATELQTKRCVNHAFDRRINEERSISLSWQRQEMLIVYKGCPGCWRDKHAKPEKKKKGRK